MADVLPIFEGPTAAGITRGAARLLYDMGYDTLAEFSLRSGRRADLMALNAAGEILIVEVKSSLADFRADGKWPEYCEWCDALFFAVDAAFPQAVLPPDRGLMVCDAYGGEVLRDAPRARLNAARRRTLTLRFGLAAARRLQAVLDDRPGLRRGW